MTFFQQSIGGRLTGFVLLGCLLIFLPGCISVGPDYQPPETQVPDAWQEELAKGFGEGEVDLQTWWQSLEDPVLTDLVVRALNGNLSLKIAMSRIEESRALAGIAKAAVVPDLSGNGAALRTRASEETVPIIPPGLDRSDDLYQLGVDSFWELDIWGRVRRSVESAEAGYQATVEAHRDAMVILTAEVAREYVGIRTLQARLRFAQTNALTQRDTAKLTSERNNAGLVPDLDVSQAELNLAVTESVIPDLRAAIYEGINRLGVLLGLPPSTLHSELSMEGDIPMVETKAVAGVPAELMRQRPDIRQAERILASQTALIGVAKAELYPIFSLSGVLTLESPNTGDLFNSGSGSYSFGPNFRWSLFSGGRVRNNIRVEEARTEQALLTYEQVVLNALEEVESSMVSHIEQGNRRMSLEKAVVEAQKSVNQVKALYRAGLTDFQNVLDMERQLTVQQDNLADSRGQEIIQLIRLYKALGGGW